MPIVDLSNFFPLNALVNAESLHNTVEKLDPGVWAMN